MKDSRKDREHATPRRHDELAREKPAGQEPVTAEASSLPTLFEGLQQTRGNAYVQRLVSDLREDEPLEPAARAQMETTIGEPLSGVRVHTGPAAAAEADRMGARAFTRGEHVYFASGKYAPGTECGRELLAHELAHVVQQRRPGSAADSESLEAEADAAAAQAAAGRQATIVHGAAAGPHRKENREEPSVARHPVEILPLPPSGVISAAGHFSVTYSFGSGEPVVLTLHVPAQVSVAATPVSDVESGEYHLNDPGGGGARSVGVTVSSHSSKPARLQLAFVHGSSTYLVVFQFLKPSHSAHHAGAKS